MLNDARSGQVLFRRNDSIALPLASAIRRSADELPYLAPEVQLLYKARHHRQKDEADFAAAIEVMSYEQRQWLKEALQTWDASDPWIARL